MKGIGPRPPTPWTPLPWGEDQQLEVLVKREEFNHPEIQGNKWWKLKYNLLEFASKKHSRIISFGGVFSNHVYALAAACRILEIPLTLYLRTHQLDENNPTVQHLRKCNSEIIPLDRVAYRNKSDETFGAELMQKYPSALIIPEGGNNLLGIKGVKEWAEEIMSEQEDLDYLCLAAGTSGTVAGMMEYYGDNFKSKEKAAPQFLVYSSLKGSFGHQDISKWSAYANYELISDEQFGGYGKCSAELIDFINQVNNDFDIQLEPLYTAKMFFGVRKKIEENYFKSGSKIAMIHTGGLQGIAGYNYLKSKSYGRIDV